MKPASNFFDLGLTPDAEVAICQNCGEECDKHNGTLQSFGGHYCDDCGLPLQGKPSELFPDSTYCENCGLLNWDKRKQYRNQAR